MISSSLVNYGWINGWMDLPILNCYPIVQNPKGFLIVHKLISRKIVLAVGAET